MRVTVFLPSLAGGGAERAILVVAGHLTKRGHAVELLVAQGGGDLVPPEGIPFRCFEVKHSRTAIPGLVRHLRAARPEVVLTALEHGNFAAVVASKLSLTGTPVVASFRTHLTAAATRGPRRQRLRLLVARLVLRGAAEVVAVSRGVADDLRAIDPAINAHVVYNPNVGPALLARAAEPLDDSWVASWEGPILLAVGRLSPAKAYDHLLRAFAEVSRRAPGTGLVIVGQGPLQEELAKQAADLGIGDAVHLPGFRENPLPYMVRCDVFVLSSRREGLPNVLIEAGALGVPVVSTDCPTGPREIIGDKPNARLVPVDDLPAMVDAILVALESGRGEPQLDAWSDHEVEASIDGYERVLRDAAARS